MRKGMCVIRAGAEGWRCAQLLSDTVLGASPLGEVGMARLKALSSVVAE